MGMRLDRLRGYDGEGRWSSICTGDDDKGMKLSMKDDGAGT